MNVALGMPIALLVAVAAPIAEPDSALASPELPALGDYPAGTPARQPSPKLPSPESATAVSAVPSESVHANAAPVKVFGLPHDVPIFGVGIDVGLPDGANLSLVTRPIRWARLQLGMGSNGISLGWRVGAALLPFRQGIAAVVEYGHYRAGNANGLAGALLGSSFRPSPLFDQVGYDYLNLHLGLNLGYRRLVFFVQGGLSIVRGHIGNANQVAQNATAGLGSTEIAVPSDPAIKTTGFAGKLGLIVYVW